MPAPSSQQFLRDLDKKLWTAADKLRSSLDAAVYKHAVLGLIFLKYVSDSFIVRQKEIETALREAARVLRPGGVFIGDIASALRRRLHPSRPDGWHCASALDSRSFAALALGAGLRKRATRGVMLLPVHRLPENWRRSLRVVDNALAAALPDAASYLVGVFLKGSAP